jgi:hypothetical protein
MEYEEHERAISNVKKDLQHQSKLKNKKKHWELVELDNQLTTKSQQLKNLQAELSHLQLTKSKLSKPSWSSPSVTSTSNPSSKLDFLHALSSKLLEEEEEL